MGEVSLVKEGNARVDILNAALSAGKAGAHIAPSLSVVDICLSVLQEMNLISDSFILSKGHGALGYYAAMHQLGIITDEQFASFETDGGEFPGQPSRHTDNKIEYSSGSLGMGMSYGLGVAIAKKKQNNKVYVIVGDGELNEGSNWEAASLAAKYAQDNLIVIVDCNSLQSDGNCCDIMGQNLEALWHAHGWKVVDCDGHAIDDIKNAISTEHNNMPLAVIAHTVKGKGVSFMENDNAWHHSTLNENDHKKAIEEIKEKYGS